MSNLSHPMIRRSEKGLRADTAGGKDPSIGSDVQPHEMESHLTSSETTTESQSTDSSDELTEPVTAETSPSVNGYPGVEMGVSGDAIPVPEVEPEDHAKVNTRNKLRVASTKNRTCRLVAQVEHVQLFATCCMLRRLCCMSGRTVDKLSSIVDSSLISIDHVTV